MATVKKKAGSDNKKSPKPEQPRATQILLSALANPRLPDTPVSRAELENPFERSDMPQVTLIEAAAGFGKTCTVGLWLQESGLPHCWLTLALSEKWAEHNASLFWEYLIGACQRLLPEFQPPAIPGSSDEKFVVAFLNTLAQACDTVKDQDYVLVIDNYHHLTDQTLIDWFDFASGHLPRNLKLVLLSRSSIKVSHRAKKLAAGDLYAINATQLSFSEQESSDFLQQHSRNASLQAIATTNATIVGWPMGLKLASLGDEGLSAAGLSVQQQTLINNYLIEDVYSTLPQPLSAIVAKTISLNGLTAEVVDELVSDYSGQVCIDLLEANSVFLQTRTDDQHTNAQSCHYQQLFANAVRQHLWQKDKKQYRENCEAAANVLEKHGFIFAAIEQLVAVEQWQQATDIAANASVSRIRSGDYQAVHDWVSLFPEHWLHRCPRLLYLAVLAATKTNQIELTEQYALLDKAEHLLSDAINASKDSAVTVLSKMSFESRQQALDLMEEIYNLRAELTRSHGNSKQYESISWDTLKRASTSKLVLGSATDLGRGMELYLRGKTQAAESAFEDAIRHAQQENYQLVMIIAANYLCYALLIMGRPMDALRRFDSTLNWIRSRTIQLFPEEYLNNGPCVAINQELNDLALAEEHLAPYIEFASSGRTESLQQHNIHMFQYRLMRSKGDYKQAELALANADALVLEELDNWNWFVTPRAAYRAHLALLQEDIVTASQWADKRAKVLIKSTAFRTEEERLILARVWIAEQKHDEVIKLLNTVRRGAHAEKRMYHLVQSYVLEALSYDSVKQSALADSALSTALTLAQPCHFQRVFIDEGAKLVPLLQRAMENQVTPDYTKSILKGFAQTQKHAVFTGVGVLIEPLSNREVEVLQLVADGLRNKGIAEQLSISLSTVKAHIYNIFSKLQTSSRTQAVSQARELGIL